MTAEEMARLHAAAFAPERGWSAEEIAALLAHPLVTAHVAAAGFALTRTVADESELLTLAVAPEARRQGVGRALVARWLGGLGGARAFLEVAADNAGAIALYEAAGFEVSGIRRGYYRRPGAAPVDALAMTRRMTLGQTRD